MSPTLSLAVELVRRPSVTPDDGGCQHLLGERLLALGFRLEPMRFGEVDNLWARRGTEDPLFCFAGHTDVVPTGPAEEWSSPPFAATVRDGLLWGRGAADMKGSLAAMVTACERFVAGHPRHRGSIAFLLTSDEEGPAVDGTVRVLETLSRRGERITWCLVGEPTSLAQVGDALKNGRRGSLNARLTVHGVQGHVAYPDRAENPIHRFAPALAELCALEWDRGNEFFPPTRFQVSNLASGTGAENVIPGRLEAAFNFRFSSEVTAAELEARVESVLARHGLRYDLRWNLSGNPFLTPRGTLLEVTTQAVRETVGIDPDVNTAGGTSDGRFIATTGAEVLELGPLNATIHQVDERVAIEDLERLSTMYERLIERLLT